MNQTPSKGRIVYYRSYGTPKGEYQSAHQAAIITDVRRHPEAIDPNTGGLGDRPGLPTESNYQVRLKIFNPDGDFNSPWLDFDGKGETPGAWSWPPRV